MYDRIRGIASNCELDLHLYPKASLALLGYIAKNIASVPLDYAILVFFTKVAQVLGLNRTMVASDMHIRDGRYGWYVNMYTMLFLGSGVGKDRTSDLIGNMFMKDVKERFYRLYAEQKDNFVSVLIEDSKEKYPKDVKRQREFVRQNEPHNFAFELSRGTPQGVYSYRKSLKDVGLGSLTLQHGEFADYYISKDENNQMFLDIMKDGYYGDTKAGVLKTERSIEPVMGVPMNMLVHSANTEFLSDSETRRKLYNFLGDGMSRRSFVCVAKANKLKESEKLDVFIKEENERNAETDPLIDMITLDFTAVYKAIIDIDRPTYKLTKKADELVAEYKLFLRPDLNAGYPKHLDGELQGRVERTIKLACVMSAYEDPKDFNIDEDAVGNAIAIVEYYGGKFRKYFEDNDRADHKKLYDYLMSKNGAWVTKSDISESGIYRGRNFAQWVRETIANVASMMFDSGMTLDIGTNGSRGERYRIISEETKLTEAKHEVGERFAKRAARVRDNS